MSKQELPISFVLLYLPHVHIQATDISVAAFNQSCLQRSTSKVHFCHYTLTVSFLGFNTATCLTLHPNSPETNHLLIL